VKGAAPAESHVVIVVVLIAKTASTVPVSSLSPVARVVVYATLPDVIVVYTVDTDGLPYSIVPFSKPDAAIVWVNGIAPADNHV